MSIRDEFAAALTTVDGVKGYPYRPKAPKVGDAWPLFSSIDRVEGLVFEVTWRVVILLPQDEVAASDWIDAHIEPLILALNPVAIVDQLAPATVNVNNADQLAAQVTMRRE